MLKLWVRCDTERLVPAFAVPRKWLQGWGDHGLDLTYRFLILQKPVVTPSIEPMDILRPIPHVTVRLEKAYREGPMAVLEPYIVLLGGGRWLVGHPEVKELSGAHHAPI